MTRRFSLLIALGAILGAVSGCGDDAAQRQPKGAVSGTAPPAAQTRPQARVIVTERRLDASGMPPFRDWGLRETAFDALARIGQPALPQLVEALHSQDPNLRRQAAWAIARIGPDAQNAVPDLIAALKDPDATVRRNAVRALGQIGSPAGKAVPQLIDIAKKAPPAKVRSMEVIVLPSTAKDEGPLTPTPTAAQPKR